MPPAQQLLFPDPRPLVERLGRAFFRELPECPGVYLMRDASDAVLYIGKAKNLRKRLRSYRVANPDRMPRRHLRLLHAVARVEVQVCPDEPSALARESELLRAVRPKFNRAGTWPVPPRYLAWRRVEQAVHLAVTDASDKNWSCHGPLGGGVVVARTVLARLVWLTIHPSLGFSRLPVGWSHRGQNSETVIDCGRMIEPVSVSLGQLLSGEAATFCEWIRSRMPVELYPFAFQTRTGGQCQTRTLSHIRASVITRGRLPPVLLCYCHFNLNFSFIEASRLA